MKNCKTVKRIAFAEEEKENEILVPKKQDEPLLRSCRNLGVSQKKINFSQQNLLQLEEDELIKQGSSNPFFRKKLEYLAKKSRRYLRDKMEIEDYQCYEDIHKTVSYSQKQIQYKSNDMVKLKNVLWALKIDPNKL